MQTINSSVETQNNNPDFHIFDEMTGEPVHSMSYDEYVRWGCLIEAVDFVCKRAEKVDMDPEKSKLWIKPLAFQKYIEERYDDLHYNLLREHENLEEEGVEDLFPSHDEMIKLM